MDLTGVADSEVRAFIRGIIVTATVSIACWELAWYIGRHLSLGWA